MHGFLLDRRLLARMQHRGLRVPFVARGFAAQLIDGAVARGGDDPAGGLGGARRPASAARAAVNASCTASSARSMSPKTRTRTATARP